MFISVLNIIECRGVPRVVKARNFPWASHIGDEVSGVDLLFDIVTLLG